MVEYIFKKSGRLQNHVTHQIDNTIDKLIVDMYKVKIKSSCKYELFYDIYSRLNRLMNLRRWTKYSGTVTSKMFERTEVSWDHYNYFNKACAEIFSYSVGPTFEDSVRFWRRYYDNTWFLDNKYKELFDWFSDQYLESSKNYMFVDDCCNFLEDLFKN